jgi:dienelactone hydrolase
MRWSAVHTGDELAKENAGLARGLPFPYSVELTQRALGVLRAQPEVKGARVALVGLSLGAARACQVADDGVVAMVFLSGAYLSRTGRSMRELPAEVWAEYPGLDADGSGGIDAAELGAYRPPGSGGLTALPAFVDADRDRDGVLRPWELAASVWLTRADAGDTGLVPSKPTLGEGSWPSEVLEAGKTPVLALYGGLDSMSFHGPWVERLAAKRPGITVEYFSGLGHQMSPERDGLYAPIAPEVVDRLAEWLTRHAVPAR